jgi:hypothetical protein
MHVRVIRTVPRPSALPDASPKQPRLNVATRPHASPRVVLETQVSHGYMRGVKHGRFKTYSG